MLVPSNKTTTLDELSSTQPDQQCIECIDLHDSLQLVHVEQRTRVTFREHGVACERTAEESLGSASSGEVAAL